MNTPESWLWPDQNIGKRRSRELREAFNALVNDHLDLRIALENLQAVVNLALCELNDQNTGWYYQLKSAEEKARRALRD